MSNTLTTYMAKFLYILRKHGVREAVLLCLDFIARHWTILWRIIMPILPRYRTITLIPGLLQQRPDAVTKARGLLSAPLHDAVDITGKYSCLYGKDQDFSGSVTAVVAHWDPHQIIDPYVQHLCKHFKELGWRVVLSTANQLCLPADEAKLEEGVDAIVCRQCPGYDFTSWKAAFHCFPSLFECRELILCNDSFFGPIGSFENMHAMMRKVPCDFWGITDSRQICPHIQSYYMVFRDTALQHGAFKKLFDAVPLSGSRDEAITFETSLALWLALHGLRPAAAFPLPKYMGGSIINPTLHLWKYLIQMGMPILKRERLRLGHEYGSPYGWNALLAARRYPLELIGKYFQRIGEDISLSLCEGKLYTSFPPDVTSLRRPVELAPSAPEGGVFPGAAVIVHCFYTELLPELCEYLKNIPVEIPVFISTVSQQKAEEIQAVLASCFLRAAEVLVVPNRGWDMMPFLVSFRDVLLKYAIVLKIHAKKSSQIEARRGQDWRALLYRALLGSQERVREILGYFAANPECGILAPPTWLGLPSLSKGPNYPIMKQLLQAKGIHLPRDAAVNFPAGGMFWARTRALKPWLDLNLAAEDFGATASSPRDGTLAHALERLYFFGCGLEEMYWGQVPDLADGNRA